MKLKADARELLSAIAAQVLRHAPADGETATAVPGLTLLRASSTALVQRGILRPSFCVVGQGEKVVQAGTDTALRYGAGNFLASSIDMPAVGQVINASKAKPDPDVQNRAESLHHPARRRSRARVCCAP